MRAIGVSPTGQEKAEDDEQDGGRTQIASEGQVHGPLLPADELGDVTVGGVVVGSVIVGYVVVGEVVVGSVAVGPVVVGEVIVGEVIVGGTPPPPPEGGQSTGELP